MSKQFQEELTMSTYSFIEPNAAFPLRPTFNYDEYIETERELWALFPETDGRRVNFVQIGLTAFIYAEVPANHSELAMDETYILMPCSDYTMRPIRMRACRRLTLSEYRMGHLTAIKLIGRINEAGEIMRAIGSQILGDEVLNEAQKRLADTNEEQ